MNKRTSAARWPHVDQRRHLNVKMTSPCRISAYLGFSVSLFHVFQNEMRYLVVSKKNNSLFVEGGIEKSVHLNHCHHSASLAIPIDDPLDGFFYSIFTLMMDSHSVSAFLVA